ncbi:MAG: type III-A CRISPR-associated protein Cas10/Csm1 [Thermosipho sp. (in: Bacteria)]|nr:type III-A CRISPR-associated protein Cas10/Csm1 [Thermosipho sp. (in: thermotogales)]
MGKISTEKVFLASIFHDIGKFFQRANITSLKKEVSERYKYFIDEAGVYGPRHQEWGAFFYENSGLPFKDEVGGAILNHHNPRNILSRIVKIADHLSAEERTETSSYDEKIKNMKSMLSLVSFGEKKTGKYKPITKLSTFGELLNSEENNVEVSYRSLWEEFNETINFISKKYLNYNEEQIKISSPLFEHLYYVLKEFTSNIPSAFYYSEPDISLFSHLSTTAAIAVSIFKQYEKELINDNEAILSELESVDSATNLQVLGIIKGDVSGIQSFIYNVSQEHAIKKLRGRSFYVTYLLEIVAKFIIENEGLSISNILYNGGGHFYLLVPAKTIDRLDEYQRRIDEIMFNAHGLELVVNLIGEKITFKELNEDIYGKISRKMEEKKNRKLESLILSKPEKIFELKPISQDSCPYCRRKLKEEICEFCDSFAELGDKLVKMKSFKFVRYENVVEKIKNINDIFKAFGYKLEFYSSDKEGAFLIRKAENIDLKNNVFYIKSANYVLKTEDGKVADLETIAYKSNGIKKWGVLRGDVDNLGKIFGIGLGNNVPLSKKATLSQEIEVFFGKFLEDIIRNEFPNCSVIYSGGDDFFILGPWSDLPYLAWKLENEFKKFCGDNPAISISMAIEVAPARKYPVYRVANESGRKLDMAKEYERNGVSKNALYFFGDIIGWEEFDKYCDIKESLKEIIEMKVTKNIIRILRMMFENYKQSKQGEFFRVWRLFYYFTKLGESYKNAKRKIMEFLEKILKNENKLYDNLYSVTYWVEYEVKEGEYVDR